MMSGHSSFQNVSRTVMICQWFYVQSKMDSSQLNLPHRIE